MKKDDKKNKTTRAAQSKTEKPSKQPKPSAKAPGKTTKAQPKTPKKTPAAPKKPTAAKAPKLKPIKHSDADENRIGEEIPILKVKQKAKPKQSRHRVLKRVAKSGGYTVFDGRRTGKTFATPEEAANYAAYMLICTGEVLEVAPTQRQITHTFKAESENKK